MDADRNPFCKAIYEGIGRKEWEELYCHYSEMSKATGAKKHQWKSRSESPLGNDGSLGQR